MNYHYDKRKKTARRWYLAVGLLLLSVLFTPIYRWVFDIIEKPLAITWDNNNRVFTGNENFLQSLYGKSQLVQENKQLQEEITRLEIDNLRTEYLSDELNKIYQIRESDSTFVSARVLKQGIVGNADTLIINHGSTTGVTIGDHVVAYDNILIGYVSDVYDITSRVTLYAQTDQSINGFLFPRDVNLTATGQGAGGFLIETPREVEVVEGDIFYNLGQSGSIIAIVRKIVFDPRDPFKQVYLSYPINISSLQTVGIKSQKISE